MFEPSQHQAQTPPDVDRIRAHTSEANNRRIDRETAGAIAEARSSPAALSARLDELDREWHVDRAVMMNFAVVGAFSAWKAMRSLKRTGSTGVWGAFFWTQMGFLANHALRGWCPPLPVFRRLGFRSAREIADERVALHEACAAVIVVDAGDAAL